eukprot:TRINITY_DN47243_c0_g1_i1.p2 TRINITY_DN47243_c0_g1~~TRINITY_DN47243_c0_g1_i1.p2  ORF type:complete len:128 (+),score=26.78 TRINITY_DN47243_c0_g1_i1:133-516(+)
MDTKVYAEMVEMAADLMTAPKVVPESAEEDGLMVAERLAVAVGEDEGMVCQEGREEEDTYAHGRVARAEVVAEVISHTGCRALVLEEIARADSSRMPFSLACVEALGLVLGLPAHISWLALGVLCLA